MNTTTSSESDQFRRVMDITIRIGAIGVIGFACFSILLPFLLPTMWGILLAVALEPLHGRLMRALGGRRKMAAAILTIVALTLLLVPAVMMASSIIGNTGELVKSIEEGSFALPAPSESVAEWPVIGRPIYETWSMAATNLEGLVAQHGTEIVEFGLGALSELGSVAGQVLLFVLATIIAGVLLATAEGGSRLAHAVARRLAGDVGDGLVELSSKTIQAVTKGVIGVALIQTVLCWLGMVVVGVPWSGLLALVILFLAVLQLPPLLVLWLPAVWAFSNLGTLPAVLFTIWSVVASSSDTVLKPMLLGRGLTTPMLIILLGAIGGMMMSGIIGLFVGAVVMALGYELFIDWLKESETRAA